MKTGSIYLILFANGKAYIGQTIQGVLKRFNTHRAYARKGSSYPVHQAMCEASVYEVSIIAQDIPEGSELNAMETFLIAEYGTMEPYGYNVSLGVGMGIGPTGRTNLSEAAKQWQKTPEGKERHRNGMMESWRRPEDRANRIASFYRPEVRVQHSASAKASHGADEFRARMSETIKSVRANPEVAARYSAALEAAWKKPGVRETMLARDSVVVSGIGEFPSVHAAFLALDLPKYEHKKFRKHLKQVRTATFVHEGRSYIFKIL